jgi:hypothetical protein
MAPDDVADAIAAAALGCDGVDEMYAGGPVEVATYLPGRRVPGVRIADERVEVQIRVRWGRPIPQIASDVQAAVAPLAAGRQVDVLIGDVAGIPSTASAGPARAAGPLDGGSVRR